MKRRDKPTLSERLYARLSRVTSSGAFIPEVDGLRFLAIAPVVIFHVRNYLVVHPVAAYAVPPEADWVARVTQHGHYGVQLFFIISGFVLALPFAKSYGGGEPVGLRRYFMRRLTRLEPPYVLVMLGSFVLLLVVRGDAASALWPRLAAGLFYLHGSVYSELNPINLVAWSLEVEVQFYLLMPLFALVFAVRRAALRRALIVSAGVVCVALQAAFIEDGERLSWSLANYLQYFLAGFLLADWYLGWAGGARRRRLAWDVASLLGWPALVLVCERPALARAAFAPLALLLFCAAFRGRVTNRLITVRWVTVVGGMCYTIYLIHFQLLSAFEKVCGGGASLTRHFSLNLLLHVALFTPVLLASGAAFFLLVEKPCMRHDWPQRLWRRVRRLFTQGVADELAVGRGFAD
jgi:peptidoglycan/LPS O-acetylase OafA/YrhL